ncbi:MAG: DHH family phosphoesterase, partial [Candidatus Bathyarchaeaceae archaeon]
MAEKGNLNSFYQAMHKAISELRKSPTKTLTLIHHDDCDGLCSAAVVKGALEREGYGVKTFCLEKIYPEVVESLHENVGGTIFYADIGSSHASFISDCNASRNLTIILDHHDPT